MLTNNDLCQTQAQLNRAVCPGCDHKSLELRLSCDMGAKCTYVAVCLECNVSLVVNSSDSSPSTKRLLSNLRCPKCRGANAQFGMTCNLTSQSCDSGVVCSGCGYIFTASPAAQGVSS
jgi:rubredoxin